MTDIVFNDADLARLEQLLTPLSISGSTMRPDEVQGFFAALASGPDAADRSMWLAEVLGDAPAFENAEEKPSWKPCCKSCLMSLPMYWPMAASWT
jgi:uncharacterized protein